MLSDDVKEDIENMLECPVCLDNAPNRTLPCGHSLCEDCAREIKGTGYNLKCPICNQIHPCSSGQLPGLPINALTELKALMEEDSTLMETEHVAPISFFTGFEQDKCNFCGLEPSVSYCTECQMYLCKQCITRHNRATAKYDATENHNVTPCIVPPKCKNCGKPARLFNTNTEIFTCFDCAKSFEFKSDSTFELSYIMKNSKKYLNDELMKQVCDSNRDFKDENVFEQLMALQESNNDILMKANMSCASLREAFDEEYDNAMAISMSGIKNVEKRLNEEYDYLEDKLDEVNDLMDIMQFCEEDNEALLEFGNLMDRIEQVCEDVCNSSNVCLDNVPRVCLDCTYVPIGGQPVGIPQNRLAGVGIGLDVKWIDGDQVKEGVVDGIQVNDESTVRVHCSNGSIDYVSPSRLMGNGYANKPRTIRPPLPESYLPTYNDKIIGDDILDGLFRDSIPIDGAPGLSNSIDLFDEILSKIIAETKTLALENEKRLPYYSGMEVMIVPGNNKDNFEREDINLTILKNHITKKEKATESGDEAEDDKDNENDNEKLNIVTLTSPYIEEALDFFECKKKIIGNVVRCDRENDLLLVLWYEFGQLDKPKSEKYIISHSLSSITKGDIVKIVPYESDAKTSSALVPYSPREFTMKTMHIKIPVKRNPEKWTYNDQDGGEGSLGHILFLEPRGNNGDYSVYVQWDKTKEINRYRHVDIEYAKPIPENAYSDEVMIENIRKEVVNITRHEIIGSIDLSNKGISKLQISKNVANIVFLRLNGEISRFLKDKKIIPDVPMGELLKPYNAVVGYLVKRDSMLGRIVDIVGNEALILWRAEKPSTVNLISNTNIRVALPSDGPIESKVGGYDLVPKFTQVIVVPTDAYWAAKGKKKPKDPRKMLIGTTTYSNVLHKNILVTWRTYKTIKKPKTEYVDIERNGVPLLRYPTLVYLKKIRQNGTNYKDLPPVIRGPSWEHGESYGPIGNLGKITNIPSDANVQYMFVNWGKTANMFSGGGGDQFDLCFLDDN